MINTKKGKDNRRTDVERILTTDERISTDLHQGLMSTLIPIERIPLCMGLVVKKVWKRTVDSSRVVGVLLSTNHSGWVSEVSLIRDNQGKETV